MLYASLLLVFIAGRVLSIDTKLNVRAACLSHQHNTDLHIGCPPDDVIHVRHAYHGRSPDNVCRHGPRSCHMMDTSRQSECDGNKDCVLTLYPVPLQDCGHGNFSTYFQLVFECIPATRLADICLAANAMLPLTAQTGYLTSPGFPQHYPTQRNCTVRLRLPQVEDAAVKSAVAQRIRIVILYMQLDCAAGNQLHIQDPYDRSRPFCSTLIHQLVFTSVGPQLDITFLAGAQFSRNDRGFWLYYEAMPLIVYRKPSTQETLRTNTSIPSEQVAPDNYFPDEVAPSLEHPQVGTSFISEATVTSSRIVIALAVLTSSLILVLTAILAYMLLKKVRLRRRLQESHLHLYCSANNSQSAYSCASTLQILNNNLCAGSQLQEQVLLREPLPEEHA